MKIIIEIIPSYRIAYLRHTGAYGIGNVQTMENLKSWAMSHHLLNDDSIILGIAQDDPQITEPESCRYDACLVISGDNPERADDINYGTIDGGKHAIFTIEHTSESMQKAWNEIFPELLQKGYQIDTGKPVMERYAVKMVNDHKCEICVPVY